VNAEVKRRWVEALRSGDYVQRRGRLAYQSHDGDNSYCCLGVLCELAVADGVIDRTQATDGAEITYGAFDDYSTVGLPRPVRAWAGLPVDGPQADRVVLDDVTTLTRLNDTDGLSFRAIARVIEDNL
jgi:hypothetical protein